MKKVGIYGGTFDPVHEGHLAFACEALEQCGLDKVFFLVEPRPRRKQGVKAFEHRTQMVRLAIAKEPKFGLIVLEQPRFTPAGTLPVLLERFKGAQLHMLMGDDILGHFGDKDWPDIEKLIRGVDFVIGLRDLTEAEVRQRLDVLQRTRGFSMRYHLFQASKPEFSSASIKQNLRRGQVSPGLPKPVFDYIQKAGLYQASSGGGISS